MTKLEKLLTELERLDKERTPGEWLNGDWGGRCFMNHSHQRNSCDYKYTLNKESPCISLAPNITLIGYDEYGPVLNKNNAEFIVACANALPQLIKVIRIQNKALKLYACDESYEVCDARLALARVEELL